MNRKEYEKFIRKEINETLKRLCPLCPHQNDTHRMNCMECCPIINEIERLAGLDGATIIKDGMTTTIMEGALDKLGESD